ncbi:MAG: FkbM family methyltransferase [Pseudomonadota bacterium]
MDLYPHHLATWPRPLLERAIRRRVQTAYLGQGLVLARILGRHKIFLRSSDRGFACHLMLDGFWEMWLTQFLAQTVKPGMRVVDVGANYGYYTLLMADAVGESGQVIAVEPSPDAAALLAETLALNGFTGRTQLVPQALGAAPGSALLFTPDSEPKNALLVGQPDLPGGQTQEVPVTTLDALALDGRRVDLIKVDAEGAEEAIVAGMQGVIARDRPLLVLEYNAARYADPAGFLDGLVSIYGGAQELTGHGTLEPLDRAAVTNPVPPRDRLLVFQ